MIAKFSRKFLLYKILSILKRDKALLFVFYRLHEMFHLPFFDLIRPEMVRNVGHSGTVKNGERSETFSISHLCSGFKNDRITVTSCFYLKQGIKFHAFDF